MKLLPTPIKSSNESKVQRGKKQYCIGIWNVRFMNQGKLEVVKQEASQVVQAVKNPPANAGDIREQGSIPGSGMSPEGGHGNPLQYSCLENPTDGGAWGAAVHGSRRVGHDWTH